MFKFFEKNVIADYVSCTIEGCPLLALDLLFEGTPLAIFIHRIPEAKYRYRGTKNGKTEI